MIDVGSPGYGIDITTAEFQIDGDTLSAALKSMEFSAKTDEEIIHLQGLQDPSERTPGQTTYEGSVTWATRQFLLFCARYGGWKVVRNKEFTLVVNATPQNDTRFYEFKFLKFRMKDFSSGFDKGASEMKISCSFLDYDQAPVDNVVTA